MHAKHAERERMGFRKDSLAEQGGGYRASEGFRKMHQLLVRTGNHAALAGEDHRALGLGDEVGGLLHGGGANIEGGLRLVAREVELRIHVAGERALGNVLRHVDEHRTGTTGGGDVIGLAGDPWKRVGVLDQVVVLHHRNGDAENVGLLERILAEHPGHRLAADHEHRDGIHHRGHQAGHGISRSGTRGHEHRGRTTGRTGIAVGHVNRALLVADEDELHLRLDRFKSVEDGDGCSAGVAEDVFDAEVIEGFD